MEASMMINIQLTPHQLKDLKMIGIQDHQNDTLISF